MAIAQLFTGSASIGTTEFSLAIDNGSTSLQTVTTDGLFQLVLDLNALTATEEYLLQIYEKARSADTKRLVAQWWFFGPVVPPIFVTPALFLMDGWDMTLDKQAGTDRTITWSVRQVA